jgi:hypothetical protein
MKKESNKPVIVLAAIILTIVAIPLGFLSYTLHFAWDSQQSGEFYVPALEIDGALYELRVPPTALAFDAGGTPDDHLYTNSQPFLGELIAVSYGDYEIEKTANPYFAGRVRPKNNGDYFAQETKYRNAKDSYQSYKFFDQNRNPILAHEPEAPNEFVVPLRPTFPAFAKRRYNLGGKREYLDATAVLKAKLNKNLKIRTDETNKLLILKFE